MNRRTIITLVVILAAAITAVSLIFYFLSFRTVSFDIVPDNLSIIIRNQDSQEVGSLESSGQLRLQDGTYVAVPGGENYATTPIEFSIDGQDTSVTIDPDFSPEYLEELRQAEQPAITQVIRSTYASVIGDFTIQPGTLYQKGEWYGGLLIQKPLGAGQNGDTYRVILKKEDDSWQIATEPKIVLSGVDYPNIPNAILSDLNAKERP